MFPFDPDDQKKAESTSERLILYGFVLVFGCLLTAEILNAFSVAKLGFFFFVAAWFALTALHEFGHAWMARAFGWRVYEVVIGFGPTIKTWRWGKTRVELNTWPLGGHMVPVPPDDQPRRLANFCIYAAGPGSELLVVALLAAAFGVDTLFTQSESIPVIAAQATCAAAIWGAVSNLFPMGTRSGAVTDGLGMIVSLFANRFDAARQQASPYLVEGYRRLHAKNGLGAFDVFDSGIARFPDVAQLHIGRFQALDMLGRRSEGMMYLQTASTDPERSPKCRTTLQEALRLLRLHAPS